MWFFCEKRDLRLAIDAVAHRAQLVRVRPGEPMAQRDIAVGRDAEQAEARRRTGTPCSRLCGSPRAIRSTFEKP